MFTVDRKGTARYDYAGAIAQYGTEGLSFSEMQRLLQWIEATKAIEPEPRTWLMRERTTPAN